MPRWLAFNSVGLMGIGVQLLTLTILTEGWTLDVPLATGIAVEAAILHNFVWHERWTWRDRHSTVTRWERFAQFNVVSGGISIVGNIAFTGLYTVTLGIHYVAANVLAIATCSLLNYVANDRFVFRGAGVDPAPATDGAQA